MKVVNLNMIYVRNIEKKNLFELHRAKTNDPQALRRNSFRRKNHIGDKEKINFD